MKEKIQRVAIKEQVAVGVALPTDIQLAPVPTAWGPSVSKYHYIFSNNHVVLVEPSSRKVVQIIEQRACNAHVTTAGARFGKKIGIGPGATQPDRAPASLIAAYRDTPPFTFRGAFALANSIARAPRRAMDVSQCRDALHPPSSRLEASGALLGARLVMGIGSSLRNGKWRPVRSVNDVRNGLTGLAALALFYYK